MTTATIADVITAEYGAAPEEVFAWWDPTPLASASIGQVHRARLPDGSEVVAKVQYPGVAEAVQSDLANAEAFTPFARLVSPNLRIRPLMEEMRERLIDELDYQREAEYQQAFHDRYAGHPFIRVPATHADYCRPRVLVSEYIDGSDFETMLAESSPDQRRRYGEVIYRFVYGSLNRFRLFNGDPHPGNYLFPDDGSVAFLDFGSVKLFSSATRDLIRAQLGAVLDGDAGRMMEHLTDAGFIPHGVAVDAQHLLAWFRLFNTPILSDAEWTYTPEYAREVIRASTDPRAGFVDLLRHLNLPPDYLLLNRIQWGVNSILGRLGARANWHRIIHELWGDTEPATALGRLEQPFLEASAYRG